LQLIFRINKKLNRNTFKSHLVKKKKFFFSNTVLQCITRAKSFSENLIVVESDQRKKDKIKLSENGLVFETKTRTYRSDTQLAGQKIKDNLYA